jgi:hypothetical protein
MRDRGGRREVTMLLTGAATATRLSWAQCEKE